MTTQLSDLSSQKIKSFFVKSRIRKNFGQIKHIAGMPDLIEIQKNSYVNSFLQLNVAPDERANIGLQSVLKSVFPVEEPGRTATLDFVKYDIGTPKYDVDECRYRSLSYVVPLKIVFRFIIWDVEEESGHREMKSMKEQEVYIGDIPLMTSCGTFIVKGTERVIVSQMHRSPGVFFYHDGGKTNLDKFLYSARVIPYRGPWLDFEFDIKDILYFRIDRKRKLPVTSILMALGLTPQDIIDTYYNSVEYLLNDGKCLTDFDPDSVTPHSLEFDLVDADTKEVVLKAGQKITSRIAKKLAQAGLRRVLMPKESLNGSCIADTIFSTKNEENEENVLAEVGTLIDLELIDRIESSGINKIKVIRNKSVHDAYIRNTLFVDKNRTQNGALLDILAVLRPGEIGSVEVAKSLFDNLFFTKDRYDLSEIGRIKLNSRLEIDEDQSNTCLTKQDIIETIKYLVNLRDGIGNIDDIDHLGNRRVRAVGELLENQFRMGMVRLERSILERMASVEVDTVMPHDLLNSSKVLMSVVKDFFNTSQLSQFMDQTNILSEITHKRRLSALGPGGVTRDRVGFEVRDVHPTHYGRICPIETPEGQNIGLINSIATYSRVNKYGFIESPYRPVKNGVVQDEVVYLSAIEEGKYKIAQSDISLGSDNKILNDIVNCRTNSGDFVLVSPDQVDFIDLTPMQVVSVAAALIPFLENDDANRALMGSNMQRQAVPLIRSEAPLVGTGVEAVVADDSNAAIVSDVNGIVEEVDSRRVVIRVLDDESEKSSFKNPVRIYKLSKFQKSNHNTCVNQVPIVNVGDVVSKGDIIVDGSSMDSGEIALGKNVLVAFIAWKGYTFEDSILVSERIAKDDVFTSIHIEEFEVVARDTRRGPEEITRDMPNVPESALRNLDEVGIVNIGAQVKAGDILVGKVTPKSESPVTPQEKLLRAIFGDKASDVRDSSLYVPPGIFGTVVEVRVFSRRGVDKDERALLIEKQQIDELKEDRDNQLSVIARVVFGRMRELLKDQTIVDGLGKAYNGKIIDDNILSELSNSQCQKIRVDNETIMSDIERVLSYYKDKCKELEDSFNDKISKIQMGDDLPQGALKVVKVFIATKRRLQPGDKMAGRHGNKGVISRIMREEDMPFLEDGTVVDVVLNPLGLPSRMNIGQILETHLGWAAKNLGKRVNEMSEEYRKNNLDISSIRDFVKEIYKNDEDLLNNLSNLSDEHFLEFCDSLKGGVHFATPVFDGAKVDDIKDMLKLSGQHESGQVKLLDGRTGEYFDRNVTVGYKYMLKLHHIVDDKMHARSIGAYSLVTQQPLGGKSHFGGQRFGEMECWALQAYGAAYTLQEMLTVKSDDVSGRIKIYESIIKGENSFESGIPESFNVMVKEFRSLALNIRLEEDITKE